MKWLLRPLPLRALLFFASCSLAVVARCPVALAQPEVPVAFTEPLRTVSQRDLPGLFTQTRVFLSLQDARPEAAYAELMRQAHAHAQLFPEDLWKEHETSEKPLHQQPLTVNINGLDFWSAVKVLNEKTGLSLSPTSHSSWMKLVANAYTTGYEIPNPPEIKYPFFTISARSVRALEKKELENQDPGLPLNNVELVLSILPDPAIRWMGASRPVVSEAVDEKGNSLLPTQSGLILPDVYPPMWNLVSLHKPAEGGGRIALLRGVLHCYVMTSYDEWSLPIPLPPGGVNKEMGARTGEERYWVHDNLEYLTAHPGPNSGPYRLSFSLDQQFLRNGTDDTPEMDFTGLEPRNRYHLLRAALADSAWVESDAGRRIYPSTGGAGWGKTNQNWSAGIVIGLLQANGSFGPNHEHFRLVWTTPGSFVRVDVPFEFRNLPLPSPDASRK